MIDKLFDWAPVAIGAVVALFIGLLVLGLPIYTFASYQNDRTWECTVEDKESVAIKDGHEYRVYTDCGNFVVEDAMFARNFHASDTYRGLEVGETYQLETIGFRIPFFSAFPNILNAEPVG